MASLKEAVYSILSTDAQNAGAGQLGALLGKTGTAPYGVYHSFPPENTTPPYITYSVISGVGYKPRRILMGFTVWAAGAWVDILDRIEALLHEQTFTADDYDMLKCFWEGLGPELYDADLKCYYQQARYEFIVWEQ